MVTSPSTTLRRPQFWAGADADFLAEVNSTRVGLSHEGAAARLDRDGPNFVVIPRQHRTLSLLAAQFASPIVLILVAATVLAMLLGELTDGIIILVIVVASGLLGFWQEHSAGRAVDALASRVPVSARVLRGGQEQSVPVDQLVLGDVVLLGAGDIVPADCRVLESRSLQIDESALSGESFPAEKQPAGVSRPDETGRPGNAVFLGTHVASGTGTVVVAQCGRDTEYGAVLQHLAGKDVITSFERGMTKFGLLLMRAMTVLVTLIFVANLLLGRPVIDSVLFSLALAVGLTPQLLPAIVAVSLSAGAKRMAAKRVIVRRLDAIEDFGGMTVLCTDKTGTLTAGAVILNRALGVDGNESPEVLRLARLNAGLQRSFSNPIDDAIMNGGPRPDNAALLDEVAYDFRRRRSSVLVTDGGTVRLVTKGALEDVLAVCASATTDSGNRPIADIRDTIREQYRKLSQQGYRVLGLAVREMADRCESSVDDEVGMTFVGLLAFHDPSKPGAPAAIRELDRLGISVRLVTGDNRYAAARIAADVGLTTNTLTGAEIDALNDTELVDRIRDTSVFAEVQPLHKERIVRALRAGGHAVGFLGDGINDSPALHAADVGISVDSAVEVAKQAASIVLLDKDLSVIAEGVRLGRQTFANTLKYVRVTISANVGNMLSMAVAAVALPFLPLLPRQILLLNFGTDIPAMTIATDAVDPEQLRSPRHWNIDAIRRFMITFGLVSSAFDLATFAILLWGFHASADAFRTAWFIESTATELVVMLVLRTARPFYQSRPSRALVLASAAVMGATLALPYLPFVATALGFTPLQIGLLGVLGCLTLVYVGANEVVKRLVQRRAM
jgi:P-type Mg2+ transporter